MPILSTRMLVGLVLFVAPFADAHFAMPESTRATQTAEWEIKTPPGAVAAHRAGL